jgi:dCTP deaminase
MILSDNQIEALCVKENTPLITPFHNTQVKKLENGNKIVSFGLSSFGYDLRVGNKFKIFTNVNNSIIDPKDFSESSFVDFEGDVCIIPPNSFVLAYSEELINMPKNVLGVVLGKSTYARCGINCLATPLEPGWSGHVTLEFANTTPLPAKIYAGEGSCQVIFFQGENCNISYSDRSGKYHNQSAAPVIPRV